MTAPEWQSWDNITAGNGDSYRRMRDEPGYRWARITAGTGSTVEVLTDDEIAALGPVRRAVVVTLPDDYETPFLGVDENGVWVRELGLTPLGARQVAAELLAAALHAEADR